MSNVAANESVTSGGIAAQSAAPPLLINFECAVCKIPGWTQVVLSAFGDKVRRSLAERVRGTALKIWAWMAVAVSVTAAISAALAADAPSGASVVGRAADGPPDHPAAGESLYTAHCAACHDHPSGRTPAKAVIASNTPSYILGALTDGVMRPYAEGLSPSEKMAIAQYLSQNRSGGQASKPVPETPTCAHTPRPLSLTGPGWNGWGRAVENTRYQPSPGLTVADAPRLKLRWAMAVAGSRNGEPVIAGGRLFTNDTAGSVYALDAKTGCAYWRFNAQGPTRSTISLAALRRAPGAPARIAAVLHRRRRLSLCDRRAGRRAHLANQDRRGSPAINSPAR